MQRELSDSAQATAGFQFLHGMIDSKAACNLDYMYTYMFVHHGYTPISWSTGEI